MIGGANSPFACMEWPGIQIPQVILNLLGIKAIRFHFLDDKGAWDKHLIHFHERYPVGRGLDFDDASEDKPDFKRYAVDFRYLKPVTNTKRSPLPP